jgi:hypothetical protein
MTYRPLHRIHKEKNGVNITTQEKKQGTKKSPQKLIYGLSPEGTLFI